MLADYLPNQVLIKLKEPALTARSVSAGLPEGLRTLLNSQGAAEISKISDGQVSTGKTQAATQALADPLGRYFLAEYPSTVNVPLLVALLQSDASVEHAQPVYIYRTQDVAPFQPNDPSFPSQTHLNRIHAPEGWTLSTGSPSVKIAIVDTGVRLTHEDFQGRLEAGRNFVSPNETPDDDNGHGTAVAGLAAATGHNGRGVAGLDWQAKIIPVKVLNENGEGNSRWVGEGIIYAADQGAAVINLSLGMEGIDLFIQAACDYAYERGAILVAAMGNDNGVGGKDGRPGSGLPPMCPALFENVIGVGSLDAQGNLSDFSVIGNGADVVAPGEGIFSTLRDGTYGKHDGGNGTSFAAPQVSGLCTLLLAKYPDRTAQQIRLILQNTADDLGATGRDREFGYGMINVYHALANIPTKSSGEQKLKEVLSFPNPAEKYAKFSFKTDKAVEQVEVLIYDSRGRKITTLAGDRGMAGVYITPEWDLQVDGREVANGSYIYVVKVTTTDGEISYGRNVLSVVR
ncbi:putative protease [Candidatus Termititenax persephonae]|uniref:Protease n=1 Tax=Candidatus Termititenax persephonae TaxID=2218525 RepID=A0A388TFS0_9BACT|nr:putative protease [Candidatus Termititenax persephonae]